MGSSDKRHYAQFAGKYANDAYRFIEHPKVHVSRIDLQVTVQYDIELLKEGRYQYARAISHNKDIPEFKRRKINLFAGSDGGDTVYVGSPSSSVRGRIYNKEKQSGENAYKRSWRYEVVYRNEYASNVYRRVFHEDTTSADFILQEVVAWYRERGVDILGVGDRGTAPLSPPKLPKSDVARKLQWIHNQVVPTIRKLAELGYAEELMNVIAEAIAAGRNEQL